jgi:hypothetical protein
MLALNRRFVVEAADVKVVVRMEGLVDFVSSFPVVTSIVAVVLANSIVFNFFLQTALGSRNTKRDA